KESLKAAERNGDKQGMQKAEQELKEAGEQKDTLDLFRKNLQSFVRAYEFLSQIVHYDDAELEQLCVFAKHLYPLLRVDRLDDDKVDVSELELTHYRMTKRTEKDLRLGDAEGDYNLQPGNAVGTGKPHDPEKKTLSEIIDRLNDLFGAEVGDDDKLHFA
ncbi:type I restriction endonuclease subunit R, partial [Pseudoalteromonas sp. GABNS16H]|nr:type I restriction endonuclease subunit R [Pseudoalteromonas sp. GABNS16H]